MFNNFKHKKYSDFKYELLQFVFPSYTTTIRKRQIYLTLYSGFSATHSLIKPDLDLSKNINYLAHVHDYMVINF